MGGSSRQRKRHVVLDRCNVERSDRQLWLQLAMLPRDATAVFFDTPVDTCIARAVGRTGHETIRGGNVQRASMVVRSWAKKLEPPTPARIANKNSANNAAAGAAPEQFAAVHVIRSDDDAEALLRRWGCSSNN